MKGHLLIISNNQYQESEHEKWLSFFSIIEGLYKYNKVICNNSKEIVQILTFNELHTKIL